MTLSEISTSEYRLSKFICGRLSVSSSCSKARRRAFFPFSNIFNQQFAPYFAYQIHNWTSCSFIFINLTSKVGTRFLWFILIFFMTQQLSTDFDNFFGNGEFDGFFKNWPRPLKTIPFPYEMRVLLVFNFLGKISLFTINNNLYSLF